MTTVNINLKNIITVELSTVVYFRPTKKIKIDGITIIPTEQKSVITNASGFATIQVYGGSYIFTILGKNYEANIPESGTVELANRIGIETLTESGIQVGIPNGGTTGQVLAKLSDDNQDVDWVNQSGGGGSSTWGSITGTLSSQTDLQTALNAKANNTTNTILNLIGNGTVIDDNYIPASIARDSEILTKTLDGLAITNSAVTSTNTVIEGFGRLQGQVNNKQNTITNSDSITQGSTNLFLTTAERTKLTNTSGTNTGDNAVNSLYSGLATSKENTITAGTTSQYWRGDKTFQTLDKTAVGLANVDNTSDLNKPISTATQTALNAKANISGQAFTGNISAPQVATTKQTLTPTGTTQTIDWNNGSVIDLILSSATGNVTLTLSNPTVATTYLIEVTNGATARNLIFPAGTLQAGGGGNTYTGTANQRDIIAVLWDGTQYLISVSKNYS